MRNPYHNSYIDMVSPHFVFSDDFYDDYSVIMPCHIHCTDVVSPRVCSQMTFNAIYIREIFITMAKLMWILPTV